MNAERPTAEGWTALLRRLGTTRSIEQVRAAGTELLERWSEPHRRYHNRDHLAVLLGHLDELHGGDVTRLAAWWHDAIYDPTRTDNEAASATLARTALANLGVARPIVGEVARLVELTRTHDPASGDEDGAALCDADLAILATSPESYEAYADAIRQEYAHLGEHDYRRGRAAVLRGLAGRPVLFHTGYGQVKWERPARANIDRELAALGG